MNALIEKELLASGLEITFFVITILFIIHAAVLSYHWFTYGKNAEAAWTALTVYLVGGAILLFTMAGAIYYI